MFVCEQLGGLVTLPVEARTRLRKMDVESGLGDFLSQPMSIAGKVSEEAKAAAEAGLPVKLTPVDALDKRLEDKAKSLDGVNSLAASKLGLSHLPPTAEEIAAEKSKQQREVIDTILKGPPSVFLDSGVPVEDKARAAGELSVAETDTVVKVNGVVTSSAKAAAARAQVLT